MIQALPPPPPAVEAPHPSLPVAELPEQPLGHRHGDGAQSGDLAELVADGVAPPQGLDVQPQQGQVLGGGLALFLAWTSATAIGRFSRRSSPSEVAIREETPSQATTTGAR